MKPALFPRPAARAGARRLLAASPALSAFAFALAASTASADPAPMRGADFMRGHGNEVSALAAAHGLRTAALARALRADHDLWVEPGTDRLIYACEGLADHDHAAHSAAEAADAESPEPLGGAVPNSTDAFLLHSLPGSQRVIYLDFTGHTTAGTNWNTSYASGADIVSAPYDTDGAPATYSTAERETITRIWQRVAEDFAPFNVDVTTEEPPLESLRRSGSTDQTYGIRVVISPSSDWYEQGTKRVGGVAYLNSFIAPSDTPAFVFSNRVGGDKNIAEAASHEAGHTFGLSHDGKTDGTAYYAGQGDWAPIMGVGYYRPLSQWSRGEYPLANNTQDDIALIARYAPVLADDHGSALATATSISPGSSTLGLIETATDIDTFRFSSGAGSVTVQVANTSPQTNLHRAVRLLDSAGNVLATAPAAYAQTHTIQTTLAAGTYYVSVEGVGSGDPATTGYSDYGSLGEYLLTLNAPAPTPATATLTATVLADDASEIYLNGTLVGTTTDWQYAVTLNTLPLVSGTNVLAVRATNYWGAAGFSADLLIGAARVGTSASWKVTRSPGAGSAWTTAAYDDSTWSASSDFGLYGAVGPWWVRNPGLPGDTTARWLWAAGNQTDGDVVYFRYTFQN